MSLPTLIDISGLDKVQVLRALWTNSVPAIFFSFAPIKASVQFDSERAKLAIESYIDYFDGRCIKCDLRGDSFDPRLYDRDFGKGKAAELVNTLKSSL